MSTISIFIIAIGLALDAFAVSVSSGVVLKKMRIHHALLIASFFGGFQGIMPFIGWSTGNWVRTYISAYDHWIAFLLLLAVGTKMIWESRKDEASRISIDPTNIYILFALAIATSIDALAVGLSLSFLQISIAVPVLIVGLVTFSMCFLGTYLGAAVGGILGRKIEALGGIILIAIGVKIVLEHTLLS